MKGCETILKIYLDNCCYNRPFDDQSQIKIHLETSCAVAAHCEYYITTDKKLLNTPIPEIKIVSPIVFVNEMEG